MLICLTVLFLLIILTPSYLKASNDDLMFFRKDSSPYGIPYSEWPKIWWQWWLSIPNNEHLGVDYDSKKCSVHQKGPVWFLPDVVLKGSATHVTQQFSCEIPKGKAILFPLSTGSCWLGHQEFEEVSNKISSDPAIDAQLKKCATVPQIYTRIDHVRINGTALDESKLDRVTTSFFNVTTPANPITFLGEIQSGTSRAIADGYFLFLRPLPEGRYLIEFQVADKVGGEENSPITTRAGQYTVFVK
jgi:hypothetical protein